MRRRAVNLIQDADANVMDRLSHQTHWVDPADEYECQSCKTLFHWNPKTNCSWCGHVICSDCTENLIVEGTVVCLTTGALSEVSIEIDSCTPCFFDKFVGLVSAYVEIPDESCGSFDTIPEESSMEPSFVPLSKPVATHKTRPVASPLPPPSPRKPSFAKRLFGGKSVPENPRPRKSNWAR
ncbi:Aste57867_24537 [Aphanomyces stellatus]|uniref:Aste57867_24537 protein n=1 Tax=Aphanomyces stellatus TaxID=120398 RepID=A0A485LRR4_9STRA|nr:hypothetical protein As57867_024460 [Aphanomyces stellatus]VFU01176.1 Aste57867_24537 [Aphanomyces stellatus]